MELKHLNYYTNDIDLCSKEELDNYFEYQKVIYLDIERMIYKISSYEDSIEKLELLAELKDILANMDVNPPLNDPVKKLETLLDPNYLAFSYYPKWKECYETFVLDIAIISRNMKNFYFIQKFWDNAKFNKMAIYNLNSNEIDYQEVFFNYETTNLFNECFQNPGTLVRKIANR